MKPALAFIFHFLIAVLVIPPLTLTSAATVYSVLHRVILLDGTPQQFYSNHLFLTFALTGLVLAYVVCDVMTSRSARWIWIPAVFAFGLRIAMWSSTGAFRPAIVEHFFTADCQIGAWRDTGFGFRCADKLFLTSLVIGTLAYSAGAVIERAVKLRHSSAAVSS